MKNLRILLFLVLLGLFFTLSLIAQNQSPAVNKDKGHSEVNAADPTITLIAPNGGENWTVGSNRVITWTSTGSFVNVKIEFSTNGGASFSVITPFTYNNGTYLWVVPNKLTSTAMIRVSNASNFALTNDVSDYNFMITPSPSVTVLSPNGKENWTVGSSRNITWSSVGVIPNVKLEYSTNGGLSFPYLIEANIPNTGSYTWTVPDNVTKNAHIRVSDPYTPTTKDVSDASFYIIPVPPTLTLTSPNGGENLIIGSTVTITWTSTGTIPNVKIELSNNGGFYYNVITPSAPNTGSYTWTVPNSVTAAARIRISDPTPALAAEDVSDENFKIIRPAVPTVTVTSPNGGETFIVGSSSEITWSSSGSFSNVRIEYSTNGGGDFDLITSSAPNIGVYSWIVPNLNTTTARIRVSDAVNFSTTTDASDNNFTIASTPGPEIVIVSPNGGEILTTGTQSTILWTSNGSFSNVKIEYSTNAGVTFSVVTSSTPNTGSYSWTVPNLPSASARIRISNAFNAGTPNDMSDANFTVVDATTPTITVTSPNGGENLIAGSSVNFTWTSTGSIPNVKIEYSLNSGVTFFLITSSAPNTGSYTWVVPSSPTASGRVRISSAVSSAIANDISNGNFTITIVQPTLTVTSPNGGETFVAGTNNNITWTSSGTFSNVKIEYSTNSGVSFSVITTSAPNTGTYLWPVPNAPTASARVRVSNAANPTTTTDISNANFTIIGAEASGITVTYPNGGENWPVGSSQTIAWTSTGTINTVKIEYSTNSGVTYNVISTGTPNSGTYAWNVLNTPTASGRVRVSSVSSASVSDISNSSFTISNVPLSVTVTSPNGNEAVTAGENYNITWSSTGTFSNVKIEYSTNSGVGFSLITAAAPNTGTYVWNVPNTPTASARVRISNASNSTATTDVSNANFTILAATASSITVTSPNGGESWAVGSNQTIGWTSTGTVGNVKIEYSLNSGVTYTPVTLSAPNTGNYSWTVPNAPTASGRVRISSVSNPSISDVSNAGFTIANSAQATLTLTSPNGGENWATGSSHNITWVSTGSVTSVKIEFSSNAGANYSLVATNFPNSGSYSWVVPGTPTASARVRISDASNSGINDVSNSVFTVSSSSTTTAILSEDFESNSVPGGVWSAGDENVQNASDYWGISAATQNGRSHSGNRSVYCATNSNVAGQFYDNYMDAYLAPVNGINISAYTNVQVSFWMWYMTEANSDYVSFQYWNGSTWVEFSGGQFTGFGAGSQAWGLHTFNVPTGTGPLLKFRWLFHSNSVTTSEGAYIDDVSLTGTPVTGAPEDEMLRSIMPSQQESPAEFALRQNYPNPFNPATVINYQLQSTSNVTLKVYNVLGEEVATLVDGIQDAGSKSITFNAGALPSGLYYYRITAGNFSEMKRMMLMK